MLGIIQGLTEFLPVSSSGHLVLMQSYLGIKEPMVFFDILLHVGTVMAVFVVYRKDIIEMFSQVIAVSAKGFKDAENYPQARTFLMIVIANIPTAIIGLTLEDYFEKLFASPFSVGIMLLLTGVILFFTKGKADEGKEDSDMSIKDALIIGVAQGMAITPGISRSGMTIATALFLGVKREASARFSFLLSIPAILGALVLKLKALDVMNGDTMIYLAGAAASFLVGVVALVWLINIVKRGKLEYFSWYVWVVGVVAIIAYF